MEGCIRKESHIRLLRAFLSRSLSRGEIEKLYRVVLTIARDTITRMRRTKHWRLEDTGLSDEDVASDACAELLACDGKELREAMLRMVAGDHEAVEVCVCLHGILERRLPQEFSRILAEYDPTYRKLLRALRDHVNQGRDVTMRKAYGGTVYSIAWREALSTQPYMPLQDLFRRIVPLPPARRVGAPMNPSVKMLYSCLDVLAVQDEYCREVHEHDVLWLTTRMLANEYEAELPEYAPSEIVEAEIRCCCDLAFQNTRAWVELSYVQKGKLASADADLMLTALEEYLLPERQEQGGGLISCLRRQGLDVESRGSLMRIFENIRNRFEIEVRKLASRAI
jgi:hypothetical protein